LRAKSPSVAPAKAEKSLASVNATSVIIGTQVISVVQLLVTNNPASKGSILMIAPKPIANDHEASSSKGPTPPKENKPIDPKYTQPMWCPPGLTKTQKRKLQRLRNQDKERFRDEHFEIIHPRIPS
jgi:hypothetical protein